MANLPPTEPLSPRKTPRQQRSAATVAAILDTAAHILEETGLEGYTTNALAARAGVSIGSVYQYFPNRDAVTRALIERRAEELMAAILAIDALATGRSGIGELIAIAVSQQLGQARMARILDFEEARMPASETMRCHGKRTADVIRTFLQQAGIPRHELGTVAGDVMAIILGMVDAAGRRNETDASALAVRVGHAVFGYLDRAMV
jgi:AcrR family transcriptional regulator